MEKDIERKFTREAERRLSALVLKFVSPGLSGVPDRIVLMPGGRCAFAEIKADRGQRLRPLQRAVQRRIQKKGFPVWRIADEEAIWAFIRFYGGACDADV